MTLRTFAHSGLIGSGERFFAARQCLEPRTPPSDSHNVVRGTGSANWCEKLKWAQRSARARGATWIATVSGAIGIVELLLSIIGLYAIYEELRKARPRTCRSSNRKRR
jgi:hypothetical protein